MQENSAGVVHIQTDDEYDLRALSQRQPFLDRAVMDNLAEYLSLEIECAQWRGGSPDARLDLSRVQNAPSVYLRGHPDVVALLEALRLGDIDLVLSTVSVRPTAGV